MGDRTVKLEATETGEPIYRRLARSLREQILDEGYEEGEPLPTEHALVQTHGVSRQTVRRAYLELVSEGLVYRVSGRGTFVTPEQSRYRRVFGSVTDLMNLTLDTELEVVSPLSGMYDPQIAERLQTTSRSLYSVAFRRLHRGRVFCATCAYLPQRVGSTLEGLPELREEGRRSKITIIGTIESSGVTILEAEQITTAVAADDGHAELLDCEPGAPLLHVERLYFDDTGAPVEYAVSQFLPEHYSHRVRLARGSGYSHTRQEGLSP